MTTQSYLEYFLVFFGWLLNNAMWNILNGTGLYLLPVVFKIVGIWLKVREEGADEGNKGALVLPRVEHAAYLSFCVIMFCCVPLLPVDVSTIKFDSSRAQQCGFNVPSPQNSGYKALVNDFDGKTAEVPVWWYFVHVISKGTTQAMIASIPCGKQLRQLRFEVQSTKLRDPILLSEIRAFADQCYSRAYFKLKNSNSALSDATINSVGWIGSSYFLNTSGYYDYYTSTEPRSQWPYEASRDSGYPDVGRGGYPTCKQWWSDSTNGLKARVMAGLSDNTRGYLKRNYTQAQAEEIALRWLVSPKNVALSEGGETYATGTAGVGSSGVTGALTQVASSFGLGMKQTEALPGFDAMKQALPMIQALLEMMIVITIPAIVMFSGYEIKTVVTISFALFALIFISFWWELAGWLDDRLITILYSAMMEQGLAGVDAQSSNLPIIDFMTSPRDGWIMNLVLGMMYLVFPMGWVGMLGWTGATVGDIAKGIANGMKDGVEKPQNAGESGGREMVNTATSAAKSAITKK
ncbi:conjugal transfer protein TraG N-terminal domain-containing protein [Dickeya fangzhongdai]|uniref:conjugal transfer protein TraG N-terminal domain-containing protein n=1 Tax=Dickeya fangzhongdai TaxID=1778540 RepID=UPI00136B2ED0|nr:conjugal transfer protein TraG N-terminal domain-containing protein [Dickeya fangzhongdai]UMB77389.1 conjugal transfer protein TraG N-terminal domain-containing protein [Dickeya fangzhongdai]